MSKFAKNSVLAISILMVAAVLVAGCSSPTTTNEALRPTKGAAFNEKQVTVFQPPT